MSKSFVDQLQPLINVLQNFKDVNNLVHQDVVNMEALHEAVINFHKKPNNLL